MAYNISIYNDLPFNSPHMDKVDLDAIIEKSDLNPDVTDLNDVKLCIKEAIRQALVLASEKAKNTISTNPNSDLGIKKAIEQSTLSVNDLVV